MPQATVVKNVVLVHGGFVDGSGWQGVYKALKKDGYAVTQHRFAPEGSNSFVGLPPA